MTSYRVLVAGGSWHGGNCTGLARGFRALGHAVEHIGVDRYLPVVDRSRGWRALRRVFSPAFIGEYNQGLLRAAELLKPHIVLVFKGNNIRPATLKRLREQGAWVANFYPDNSLLGHRDVDTAIFALFDHIFTTKQFGLADFERHLGITRVSFLPHGFDPHVHRPFPDPGVHLPWATDVSFIGTWSPHKERLLASLRRTLGPGRLRIWGAQWDRRSDPILDDVITNEAVLGDRYALAVSASRINLGLLSEQREGASDDDQITSRTFHIPACGGFLLHERTDEVLDYFEEEREIACFSSEEELGLQVLRFLEDDPLRRQIAAAGHERCVSQNSLVERARAIVERYEAEKSVKTSGRANGNVVASRS